MLIDYPDQWDARQIVAVASAQIWDETLAVLVPSLDSRRDVIPQHIADQVFAAPAMQMVMRVERRMMQSHGDLTI